MSWRSKKPFNWWRAWTRLLPIENAAMNDRTIIEWDKDDLDAMGLLKIAVLALGMGQAR